jgi:hypothetical protein
MASKDGGSLLKVEFSHKPARRSRASSSALAKSCLLIEHDWKAKPVRFDVGRKRVKLVVGEHRKQRGGLMDGNGAGSGVLAAQGPSCTQAPA